VPLDAAWPASFFHIRAAHINDVASDPLHYNDRQRADQLPAAVGCWACRWPARSDYRRAQALNKHGGGFGDADARVLAVIASQAAMPSTTPSHADHSGPIPSSAVSTRSRAASWPSHPMSCARRRHHHRLRRVPDPAQQGSLIPRGAGAAGSLRQASHRHSDQHEPAAARLARPQMTP